MIIAELYLLLGMFTPVSWLERCPSYKDMINTLSHKDLIFNIKILIGDIIYCRTFVNIKTSIIKK